MEINIAKEEVLYGYDYLNYNENYIVSSDMASKLINMLIKLRVSKLIYIGYANRGLIDILNELGFDVFVIHIFKETIPLSYYEYKAKVFDEYYCSEGLPLNDILIIDVPIAIYDDWSNSKVFLFGESNRKLYKSTSHFKYVNLAEKDNLYVIDKIRTYKFD